MQSDEGPRSVKSDDDQNRQSLAKPNESDVTVSDSQHYSALTVQDHGKSTSVSLFDHSPS